jgi:hypothetical protein
MQVRGSADEVCYVASRSCVSANTSAGRETDSTAHGSVSAGRRSCSVLSSSQAAPVRVLVHASGGGRPAPGARVHPERSVAAGGWRWKAPGDVLMICHLLPRRGGWEKDQR